MTAARPSTEPVAPYRPSWLLRRANTMLTRVLDKGRGPRFMRLLTVHVTARSPDHAIAAEAHRHPVFELTPIR